MLAIVAIVGVLVTSFVFNRLIYGSPLKIELSSDENYGRSTLAMILLGADYTLQGCCTHSAKFVEKKGARDGVARRFEVRPEDPKIKNGYRSELRIKSDPLGRRVVYSARMYLPQNLVNDVNNFILMQWHGTRDYILGEKGRAPPLDLSVRNGDWRISKAWDSRLYSKNGEPEGSQTLVVTPISSSGWHEWKFEVVWATGSEGRVRAWLNGALVVDDKGPNCHNDFVGPYLKAGIYATSWKEIVDRSMLKSRWVYFDQIEVDN